VNSTNQSTVKLGSKVSIQTAEKLLDEIFPKLRKNESFLVDCSKCQNISLGAGYRIGNVLRMMAELGPLIVRLPPTSYSAEKVSGDFFLSFTRSGLGPAIARYASTILAADEDVTDKLKAYYHRTLGVGTQNSTYVLDLHLGSVEIEDEARFGRFLTGVLSSVNVGVAGLDRTDLGAIIALCFEGVQNVADHATKKPFNGNSLFSYLAVRYYKRIFSTDDGVLTGYFKRATKQLGEREWIELLINDDGVGIPARHQQDLGIYRGQMALEEKVLEQALHRSSVKLRAGDSKVRGGVAGEGFSRMRTALRGLKAFAAVRSGRCFATFAAIDSRQETFSLNRGNFGLPLGYMPGTAIQVVIPLPALRDRQPSLIE
jgi:hypothetical protein